MKEPYGLLHSLPTTPSNNPNTLRDDGEATHNTSRWDVSCCKPTADACAQAPCNLAGINNNSKRYAGPPHKIETRCTYQCVFNSSTEIRFMQQHSCTPVGTPLSTAHQPTLPSATKHASHIPLNMHKSVCERSGTSPLGRHNNRITLLHLISSLQDCVMDISDP